MANIILLKDIDINGFKYLIDFPTYKLTFPKVKFNISNRKLNNLEKEIKDYFKNLTENKYRTVLTNSFHLIFPSFNYKYKELNYYERYINKLRFIVSYENDIRNDIDLKYFFKISYDYVENIDRFDDFDIILESLRTFSNLPLNKVIESFSGGFISFYLTIKFRNYLIDERIITGEPKL